ncbi:transmembrane protein, putative (macronuclear) [Tetrahymena thermophila SB210]|uniref:Transmembrane protein, putative n=1 Tax=Tetrahymena thermophila (strain SB210) TaxID=312017 RepID=I7MFD8_TETTS|nr:transmembrane protein, putative [Tetrahymena thermophila SB210]EAR83821.3 transmembrane protein, putative [Tetrahymena thermophila SB210]|eukprot:XP_001031484.3 transmembrane protein, putative [Tetrahymena thermophila SB210]
MIRNIGEKILQNKKVLMLIERLSFLVLLAGILYTTYVANDSEYSKIEENALSPSLGRMNTQNPNLLDYFKQISESMANYTEQKEVLQFLEKFFDENNMEYQVQNFTQKTENGVEQRQNIAGLYRSKRSNNYECNLISFDINPVHKKISIPFALAFAKYYENHKVNYLSRDIIFLGYDSRGKKYGYSVEQFIKENLSENSQIPKCGVIRQALNLDLDSNFQQLYLKTLGFDGKVPDRDYFLGFNNMMHEALSESGFKYSEISFKIPNMLGNFLERILHEVGQQLQMVFPLDFFKNFKYFFHILMSGIYGDKHDAHSQMIYHGIQAITIKGKYNPKIQTDNSNTITQLFNAVESSQRANFSLDEQLHAGSTLYYPLTKNRQITIKLLPISIILVCAPFAIQYLKEYFNKKNDPQTNLVKIHARTLIGVFHSFFMLSLPTVAQILYPYVFPNSGDPVFCQDWSSFSHPQLLNLFYLLAALIILTRLLFKIILEYVVLKGILKCSLKESKSDGDFSATANGLILGLFTIIYLFINTSIAYISITLMCPLFYISKPLIPRSAKDFLRTVAIFACYYLVYTAISQFQLNYLNETIEAVITQQCIQTSKVWFALCILFNLVWNKIEIYLI